MSRAPRPAARVPLAWRTAGALSLAVLLTAHVGTSDVFFAGNAGPWNVRVSIRQPGVIPGLADISVRVAEPGVEQVLVTARQSREGGGEAPPPDVATEVRGETGLYAAQLWLMNTGTHEVAVTVEGTAGQGVARIPIVAAATRQLEMAKGLQFLILGGGLFLVLGLLTIVGTASRESVLPAGTQPMPADRRRAWRATAVAALVLGLVLYGGWAWVRAESELHRSGLDRPWSSMATMHERGESRVLEFAITEPLWVNRDDDDWRVRNNRYRRADLIPDHGKMMHMFVVRDGDMAAFAHVHPERLDANRFAVAFPPLPPGPYRVYADITHEDGYAHTLVASVEAGPVASVEAGPPSPQSADASANRDSDQLADPVPDPAADPDDAWWIAGTPVRPDSAGSQAGEAAVPSTSVPSTPVAGEATTRLSDGSVMRWLNAGEPLEAGRDADLVIRVENVEGSVVALDPYMGMQGHAMLSRTDGEVFVHLHPSGMISMAAQTVLNTAVTGMSGTHDGINMSASANVISGGDGTIRFPFVVPAAGPYRIWVQVRRGDSILTGSFDTVIVEEVG